MNSRACSATASLIQITQEHKGKSIKPTICLQKIYKSVSGRKGNITLPRGTMIAVFMIFTAFAVTIRAKGIIECSFPDSTGPQQCYGAEGQQLIFHLSNEKMTEIRLKKDENDRILKIDKNGTVTFSEDYVNQLEQVQPRTFRLSNAMKEHSGDYVLEEYGTDGQKKRKVQVHLKIQRTVSNPVVSQRCFSPEQKRVTCSSYGDDVEFFLTLDGHTLIKSRDQGKSISNCKSEKSDVSNICINIHGQLSGDMCQVWNNVSSEDSVYHLTACKGSETVNVPIIAVSTAAISVVLGFIAIKLCKKRRPMPPNEGNAEKEIIYADVKVKKDTRRTKPNIQGNTE